MFLIQSFLGVVGGTILFMAAVHFTRNRLKLQYAIFTVVMVICIWNLFTNTRETLIAFGMTIFWITLILTTVHFVLQYRAKKRAEG